MTKYHFFLTEVQRYNSGSNLTNLQNRNSTVTSADVVCTLQTKQNTLYTWRSMKASCN